MCISLKLEYAKFGVSNLLLSNVIEKIPLGGRLDPLGKRRLKNVWFEPEYNDDTCGRNSNTNEGDTKASE